MCFQINYKENVMPKLGDLTGTPWHIEKFTRADGDERRHKSMSNYSVILSVIIILVNIIVIRNSAFFV